MAIKNLDKISNAKWTLTWSGNNYTLLDTAYQFRPEFDTEWLKICGIPNQYCELVFVEDGFETQYSSEEALKLMNDVFLKKFETDPKFLARSGQRYRERANADIHEL